MKSVTYQPIGTVRSPFVDSVGTPIQPGAASGVEGSVDLDPAFAEGLLDLDAFSHIILIYHFHKARPGALQAKPFMDDRVHGVFAMRGPSRPNPIGLSIVRLLGIERNRLRIANVDILDGTPVLDIKPYVPQFDAHDARDVRIGWLEKNVSKLSTVRDDGRFAQSNQ